MVFLRLMQEWFLSLPTTMYRNLVAVIQITPFSLLMQLTSYTVTVFSTTENWNQLEG